jgi:hypothetical protein
MLLYFSYVSLITVVFCNFAVRFELHFLVIGYNMQSCFDAIPFAYKVPSSLSLSFIHSYANFETIITFA